MCLVLPFHVERYQHLDNNSLKKVLLACQQVLLKETNQFGYYDVQELLMFVD